MDDGKATAQISVVEHELDATAHPRNGMVHGNAPNEKSVDTNFQGGVQKAEATTITWTRKTLIVAYIAIWMVYAVQGIVTGVSTALLPYVTSAFAAHSLLPTTSVLSSVIGGVSNLCVAKVLDIFGRPHGFLLCVGLATVGLITSAACNGIEAYAASQVFYIVGINGLGYCLTVFIADTSSLRHRGFIQALCNSPYLITSWLAGPISTGFLNGAGWRWAFGMDSILLPAVAVPLFVLFLHYSRKAQREGILPAADKSGRTFSQSAVHYIHEFDVVGLLLVSVGFAFFLLPFNLYTMAAKGWASPLVICFLVFGLLFIAAFVAWERYFARKSLVPWHLLRDREVLGTCIVAFVLFLSNTCWNGYLSSFLQVVNNLSVTHASYVVQSGVVVMIVANIVTGALISATGRYKPVSLFLALPLNVLGIGLFIYFRQPQLYVGYVVMCNVLVQFSGGILMLTLEIAILAAAAEQQYFAITIALLNLFMYLGSAIGYTISAAIWQPTLPEKLALYLPADDQANIVTIFTDIVQQLSYPWDSPTRLAIQHAYGDAWRLMLIAGVAVWAVGLAAMLAWRNVDVRGIKQTKGTVI